MTLEEPTRIFPPHMSEPATEVKPRVWRVSDVEIDEIVPWVAPLLKKRWPRLFEDDIARWFKCLIGERRALFIRTENIVALAEFDATTKEPWPVVTENFVRAREGYSPDEPMQIHKRFLDWAIDIGAVECRFNVDTNVPIKAKVGSTKVKSFETRGYHAAILRE